MEWIVDRAEDLVDSFLESRFWRQMVGLEEEPDGSSVVPPSADSQLRRVLLEEYKQLAVFTEGVLIVPQPCLTIWEGLVFVDGEDCSPYQDGIFKFRVEIPKEYPLTAPAVFFQSNLFHPMVCVQTGELDISLAFPHWTPGKDYLALLIAFIRNIFRPEIYSRAYCPALIKNPDKFSRKAAETAQSSAADLWHCSEHDDILTFEPVDEVRLTRLQHALFLHAADPRQFVKALTAILAT